MMEVIGQIKNKKPDFAVLSGDDGLTLPLIAAGGDGIISVASNMIPALMHELAQSALDGDFKKAREIHYRLAPFFKAEFCDGNIFVNQICNERKGYAGRNIETSTC